MKLYKLTDSQGQSYNATQWDEGVTHTAKGPLDQPLCSSGWLHAYEHPNLAALLNPIHANFTNPILWEAEGDIGLRDGQLKCGCRTLTTIKQIPLPTFTTTQRVAFAILYAKTVCTDENWNTWANNWLSGTDRSAETAAKAAWAAEAAAAKAAAWAEAWAAAETAAKAAARAARVAEAREKAARVAEARVAEARETAARVAAARVAAARVAEAWAAEAWAAEAWAAETAAKAAVNLIKLSEEALNY